MSAIHRQIAGPLPAGFVWAVDWIMHPIRKTYGSLLRNERTGIYVMLLGGATISVPQAWARKQGEQT